MQRTLFYSHMLFKSFLRWTYPEDCQICKNALLLTEESICRSCFTLLKNIEPPACTGCGIELAPYGKQTHKCSYCKRKHYAFDEMLTLFRYEEKFKKIIHEVKFHRKFWILDIFRKKLKRHIKQQWADNAIPDTLIPVPLDKKRLQERKFNQSLLLAKIVSSELNAPIRNDVLVRNKSHKPQSWLSRKERLKNTLEAFDIRPKASIDGKWILLIDDVITTGSTVQACAKKLKENGARKVSVLTLARTQ